MLFGRLSIEAGRLHTHNDSYVLRGDMTISARRPFLGANLALTAGIAAFTVAFADLLTAFEITAAVTLSAIFISSGFWLGQLQLLNRDLKGSELSTVIWGSYTHLNRIRRDIADAINLQHRDAPNNEVLS